MRNPLELLREEPLLRALLAEYARYGEENREAEWLDRIMAFAELERGQLSRLHGALLANGWLEANISPEAYAEAGRVRDVYQVTREGRLALKLTDPEAMESAA